jgi:catechol 2,3-dioxygenase-like lactoylglutathione lyase family enzyme
MKYTKTSLLAAFGRIGFAAFALTLAASSLFAQGARPTDVLGIGMVGLNVADIDRSIKFYEALDFKVAEGPSAWKVDEDLNKLGNTPKAESRTAVMRVQSSVSDVPFTFVLRQYRGIERQDWSKANSWDLLASHIDLTIEGSVSPLLDKLEGMGMLKMPEINGLQNPRQQSGFRPYAFIQDPDGFVIEYFGKQPAQPNAAPRVSNSKATNQNIDRWGKQAGFNHYATNIIDVHKAQDFYVEVLGGDYPTEHAPGAQVMLHGWFPQATTDKNVRVELIYFEKNKGLTPPAKKFQDINTSYAGFQVSNIDTAYARAKQHGAITVTQGGIMKLQNNRAVVIRDPDVGGYIMLFQPTK